MSTGEDNSYSLPQMTSLKILIIDIPIYRHDLYWEHIPSAQLTGEYSCPMECVCVCACVHVRHSFRAKAATVVCA